MSKHPIVAGHWSRFAFCLTVAGIMALAVPRAAPAQGAGGPAGGKIAPALSLAQIPPRPGLPLLTVINELGGVAHVFPTVANAAVFRSMGTEYDGGDPPLVYHSGGSVMAATVIYTILWVPSQLQNGGATGMPSKYRNLVKRLATDYPGHGIDNVATQYYEVAKYTAYIHNAGYNGGYYVDTSNYPASGCTDSATPGNCITDAQIQSEMQKVMSIKGWTGGLGHIFLLYTSSGEGSCFDSGSSECAYTQYCAYHSYIAGTPDTIYANLPFGNTTACQLSNEPSPNNDPEADAVMTGASHEITEARTDPLLNAWFTATLGYEIGDLCAYDYGTTNTWDSGNANESWNGHYYLLQTEFDNHAYSFGNGCVQVGPYQATPSSGAW